MHIAFLNQYYPPDKAPTGEMLKEVAERLSEEGRHRVTVLCGSAAYAGISQTESYELEDDRAHLTVRKIRTTRLGRRLHLGRIVDYASFYFGAAWKLLFMRPRPDRIVALTTPPFLSALARMISKLRRGDHGHWVMDLYPDVMFAHGMIRDRGFRSRCLNMISRWGFGGRRCALIATLGPDMAERVGNHLRGRRQVDVVPLWAAATANVEEKAIHDWRVARGWRNEDLVLMYSGNMGLGHRFVDFLKLARRMSEEHDTFNGSSVRWVFTGGGNRRPEIEAFIDTYPHSRVELGDYVSKRDLAVHLSSADVHLVSLEPSWDGTMVPSKLQGIFAIGRPVIFVGSESCAIGQWIHQSQGGWIVAPGDETSLINAVHDACDADERRKRGAAARAFAEEHFDRDHNVIELAEIFSRTTSSPRREKVH